MPPKQKSFAEKMLKSQKPAQEFDFYRVIKAFKGKKGGLRYENRVVQVKKGTNENEALGI